MSSASDSTQGQRRAGPPVLSVIIPVRNHAKPLRRLLNNLRTQETPPGWEVEIIVVEYNSTDNTLDVIRESGMRCIECSEAGVSAGRNAGVKAAKGSLLYFIDADACPAHSRHFIDLIAIGKQLRPFGAFGGPIRLTSWQRWNPIAIGDHWACWFNWHAKRPQQRTMLFQPSVSLVVPRKTFETIGGFNTEIAILEDMEFQHRLMRAGYPIYFAPGLVVTHEARGSLSSTCRHSWSWGGPFRTRYLTDVTNYELKYPVGHKRFARNLPMLFRRRMKLVTRAAWANSKLQTCYSYPFLALTVLVWTMAVVWGDDRRPRSHQAPIRRSTEDGALHDQP